jgi:hypothetical protein
MRLQDFALERFFARWEFSAEMLLCASDIEGWPMHELLELADEDGHRRWHDLRLGYTESPGDPALRTSSFSRGRRRRSSLFTTSCSGPATMRSWFARRINPSPKLPGPPAPK